MNRFLVGVGLSLLIFACGDSNSAQDSGVSGDTGIDASVDAPGEDAAPVDGSATDAQVEDSGTTDSGSIDSGPDESDAGPPPVYNTVFVTSTSYQPGVDFDSVEAADELCAERAAAASLTGTFIAFLSSSTVNAIDRLAGAVGFARTDGRVFANLPTDIANGAVLRAIDVDEFGAVTGNESIGAWTGSNASGGAESSNCGDWALSDGGSYGAVGGIQATRNRWLYQWEFACTESLRLYCFQTDLAEPLHDYEETGRLAFVSESLFTPGGGIDAADELCTEEANDAGHAGTFHAMLGTTTEGFADRFDLSGEPWVRPDGIGIAETPAATFEARLLAPINVDLNGEYIDDVDSSSVWSGTNDRQASIAEANCNDWTSSSSDNYAWSGAPNRSGSPRYASYLPSCDSAHRLYCLEM